MQKLFPQLRIKGERSAECAELSFKKGRQQRCLLTACGPAAILAQNCIKNISVIEFEELGMEAIFKIEVEDFPAFIVVDDKNNDFYSTWLS